MPLYVSPVECHVVSRYGSATKTANNEAIGQRRDPTTGAFKILHPQIVVMIPDVEAQRFAREYDIALREKALIRRTEEEFKAWRALELTEETKKKAEAEEAAKKKAGGEPKEAEAAPKPEPAKAPAGPLSPEAEAAVRPPGL